MTAVDSARHTPPRTQKADKGNRTLDIQLGKLTLYQLSYARDARKCIALCRVESRERRVICGQRNVRQNSVRRHSNGIALGTRVRSEGDGAINEANADDARTPCCV